ncbi:MAG: hypothetical protein GF355_01385 [Candidatus Eisenbacteria bacterium]|nr:hypothetical protein [Candidatus Eisenbacteria bacterium]
MLPRCVVSESHGEAMFPPQDADVQLQRREAPADAAYEKILRKMARYPTMGSLRRSSFWKEHAPTIEARLRRVQRGEPPRPHDPPGRVQRLRLVHWNVERGKQFRAVLQNLKEHPALRAADIVFLNEVDVGMARSRNRHVARELAEELNLHWAFAASYIELSKGIREETQAPGTNSESLHGVAILSRQPFERCHRAELPEVFDAFSFAEKRYGRKAGLIVRFGAPWGNLVAATAHLEVRHTPQGRRRQLEALLGEIDRFLEQQELRRHPVALAGDFNSHTFPRANVLHTARAAGRLLATPIEQLAEELAEPWRGDREPLFRALHEAGYSFRNLNDRAPTVTILLRGVEETEILPARLRRWMDRAASLGERVLPMRLDWFAARFLSAAGGGRSRGFFVRRAATVVPDTVDGLVPSDHLPLVLELETQGA